jgi:3D (Asp-Asp-Asp) domain-containing protein
VPITITLNYSYQTIPTSSAVGSILVSGGEVLYQVRVQASVSGGTGMIGKYLTFSNPNTATVKKVGTESSINPSYYTIATYEVRGVQSFSVTASINDSSFTGTKTTTITNPLGAFYDSGFYCTCYNTSSESDFSGSRTTSASGITGSYKSSFLNAVKLNGSGWSMDNTWIRYNASTSQYSFTPPTTATGTMPTVNKTIAVDWDYIPRLTSPLKKGTVEISGLTGKRLAEDAGGAIDNYDIDMYWGVGNAWQTAPQCNNATRTVKYLGNNLW